MNNGQLIWKFFLFEYGQSFFYKLSNRKLRLDVKWRCWKVEKISEEVMNVESAGFQLVSNPNALKRKLCRCNGLVDS